LVRDALLDNADSNRIFDRGDLGISSGQSPFKKERLSERRDVMSTQSVSLAQEEISESTAALKGGNLEKVLSTGEQEIEIESSEMFSTKENRTLNLAEAE